MAARETPETSVTESDPNADGPEGLAGGMGVSSERTGPARGAAGDVTYAAEDLAEPPPSDAPEQSVGGEEVHPDRPPLKDHSGRLHGGTNRPRSSGE